MPIPRRHTLSCPLRIVLLLCLAMTVHAGEQLPAEGHELLHDVRRIVFLGDSITQKGDYVADMECWLLSRSVEVEVLNLGLGSETATDLTPEENKGHVEKFGFGRPFVSERLGRVLSETKPDLLFVCYGMNDGVPTPRYAEAVTRLREEALKSGVKRVVICTPPVHDNKKDAASDLADKNLARYTEWLLGKRNDGWLVVDIHTPMRATLTAARSSNPNFLFAEDGVHPSREGHWLMAREILRQAFGEKALDLYCSEQIFPFLGAEIRDLVRQRQALLFNAWMSKIGHTRPNVAGGPQAPRGPSLAEAVAKAKPISDQIIRKLTLTASHKP